MSFEYSMSRIAAFVSALLLATSLGACVPSVTIPDFSDDSWYYKAQPQGELTLVNHTGFPIERIAITAADGAPVSAPQGGIALGDALSVSLPLGPYVIEVSAPGGADHRVFGDVQVAASSSTLVLE